MKTIKSLFLASTIMLTGCFKDVNDFKLSTGIAQPDSTSLSYTISKGGEYHRISESKDYYYEGQVYPRPTGNILDIEQGTTSGTFSSLSEENPVSIRKNDNDHYVLAIPDKASRSFDMVDHAAIQDAVTALDKIISLQQENSEDFKPHDKEYNRIKSQFKKIEQIKSTNINHLSKLDY